MMKRFVSVLVALLLGAVTWAQTAVPPRPTEGDMVKYMLEITKARGVTGASKDVIVADRSENNYRFIALTDAKGAPLYYGGYVNNIKIYSHLESLVVILDKTGTIVDFMLPEAVTRHGEMWYYAPVLNADGTVAKKNGEAQKAPKQEPNPIFSKWKAKFVGKDWTFGWDPKVDVVSGSTFSSIVFPSEMRALALAFKLYVIDAKLLK
jgi:hypothetical protein